MPVYCILPDVDWRQASGSIAPEKLCAEETEESVKSRRSKAEVRMVAYCGPLRPASLLSALYSRKLTVPTPGGVVERVK